MICMHVKGFTRQGKVVVNTDTTEFEAIKQRRQVRKVQQNIQGEVAQLREMVLALTKRIEVLELNGRDT